MMAELVTPIYAAFSALLFVWLSVRTLRLRRKLKISIGTGDNPLVLRAMRVHSNFAEYAPLGLLLALMLELMGGSPWLIHLVCLLLTTGRLMHAYGVSHTPEDFRFRVCGMTLTLTSLCTSAIAILFWQRLL